MPLFLELGAEHVLDLECSFRGVYGSHGRYSQLKCATFYPLNEIVLSKCVRLSFVYATFFHSDSSLQDSLLVCISNSVSSLCTKYQEPS